ncbi:MAG: Ppx/GppA family phosphatase [Candidatus Rokubacteria bacterium]|nr:Ppx/GppA family phosphatase [Candidatus Rokubacteria bacterium]
MRVSTIDLGSNTVRLLVADVAGPGCWRVVAEDQAVTRLGEGLAATGALGEAPMARTLAVVSDYAARGAALGATEVRIVATSAVREAANGFRFAAAVERATGRRLQVVSGEDEARLVLLGVRHGVGPLAGPMVVFDIGGGSTEYILAEGERVRATASLRLGVVPLAERYPFPERVDRPRYEALLREITTHLERQLPGEIRRARPAHLVGTAGTVTTLAALDLDLERYEARRVQGHRLSRAAIERLGARLGSLTVAERAALPCLEPGRADLIVPGVALVAATLDCLGVDALIVSDSGLREGILAAAADAAP